VIFKVQVMAMTDDGSQEICEIASVERTDLKPETLGLTLAEGKAILKGIQQTVIQRQISSCLAPCRQCPHLWPVAPQQGLSRPLACPKVKSPRLHHCHCQQQETGTFSPPSRSASRPHDPRVVLPGNQMGVADEL
jgi:hypothetical protein